MGEFANSAKELGLGHAGAEKLLQLHAKALRQADATMEQQSQTWQQETLAAFLLRAGESDRFDSVLAADGEREAMRRRLQLKTLLFGMGETFRVMLLRKDA